MEKIRKTKATLTQREKFIQIAKELDGMTEAAFNTALKRVGSAKVAGVNPKPKAKPSKKSR